MENISSENRRNEMELDKEMMPVNRYHDEKQDESSARLPDELVEKIISSMPFPYILRAKELSKESNSKFSNTKNAETTGFRQMVYSNCSKWPIFFPLHFLHGGISLTGFDRRLTGTWLKTFFRLPCLVTKMLDSVPHASYSRGGYSIDDFTGMDSLICGRVSFRETEIFVLNVCTGIWKWLPPPPNVAGRPPLIARIYMLRDGSDYYKVLTMTQIVHVTRRSRRFQHCMQLYESKSDAWTTITDDPLRISKFSTREGVYPNGSVFFIKDDHNFEVWACNIEKGTWHQLRIPGPLVSSMKASTLNGFRSAEWIVSKDRLMFIVRSIVRSTPVRKLKICSIPDKGGCRGPRILRNSLRIYEINTHTENFSLIYRGPPARISAASTESCISEGDSIFFNHSDQYTKYIMELRISSQEWIFHPNPSSPYCGLATFELTDFILQPGKNPFIVV